MKLSSYLCLSRHGVYYFRWPMPKIANQKRTTLKLSLKTRCPDQAGDLSRYLAFCGKMNWKDADLTHYKRNDIRKMVKEYFQTQLHQYMSWLETRGLSPNALEDARCEILDHESCIEAELDSDLYLPIKRFLNKSGISEQDWQDSQPTMQRELRMGRRDMLKRVLEVAESLESYSYENVPESHLAPSLPSSAPLGRAIDDFIEEHSRQWPEKTTKQIRAYLNILLEHCGSECLLEAISKQDASDVKKVLQALPASRNIKPELKGLSLSDVIKVNGYKLISPKTINSHIDTFRRFFDWAERHGHAPHKLFEGMKVPKSKSKETERKAFTKEQTHLILAELTENKSGLVNKESHKWASLLGLFTGARLNEICQLETADIQCDDDIWFMNITDEGDNNKRVKSDASIRRVPLHSKIIKLGFLSFVEKCQNQQRLFHDYSYRVGTGYGRNLGRWYNEAFLPELGIKEQGLVFHSLRHTMVTRLAQASVSEPVYQEIVGHERQGVTQQVYNKSGHTLAQKQAAIEMFGV